jgi:hypothetical protein
MKEDAEMPEHRVGSNSWNGKFCCAFFPLRNNNFEWGVFVFIENEPPG